MKQLVDGILRRLSPAFDAMYAGTGRPSVPPERLLKAMVLMALYGVRSERLFCEQLGYNVLYRWFLDMDLMDRPFDPTAFSHNRARLLQQDVAGLFLAEVVEEARKRDLMSSEHYSVDGTLIEAWASMKSFRPKDESVGDNNGFADFVGERRSNETHESKTDPEARLIRKGRGKESKLAFMGHVLMENRNGLVVDFELTPADGHAERDAAANMLGRERKQRKRRKRQGKRVRRTTIGADKGYDAREFRERCERLGYRPHIPFRTNPKTGETLLHRGADYEISARKRRLIEKIFGWMKTTAAFRRTRYRGVSRTGFAARMIVATYDALRILRLSNPAVA